jgi:hypothetical protein
MKVLCCVVLFGMIATLSSAGNYRYADKNGDWMSAENWQVQSPEKKWRASQSLPGEEDEARFSFLNKTVKLSADAGTIDQLRIGTDGTGGNLTVENGAKLTMITGSFIGLTSPGKLTMNGGTLIFKSWLSVADDCDGTLVLNNGLIRVDDKFHHNLYNVSGIPTTSVRGGMLVVSKMELDCGVLDIAGGTVRIQKVYKTDIQQWIDQGFLTFYGASEGLEGFHYTLTPLEEGGFEIVGNTGVKTVG